MDKVKPFPAADAVAAVTKIVEDDILDFLLERGIRSLDFSARKGEIYYQVSIYWADVDDIEVAADRPGARKAGSKARSVS